MCVRLSNSNEYEQLRFQGPRSSMLLISREKGSRHEIGVIHIHDNLSVRPGIDK